MRRFFLLALSSHIGVLVDELILPDHILLAAFAVFGTALFLGGVLTEFVGWPILVFGLVGLLGGIFYTGGFIGYKYKGMGGSL